MESWSMPLNEILPAEITRLDHTLIPPGFRGDMTRIRLMERSLAQAIDFLGEGSSVAQGLNKVITTAEKMRDSQNHILYLLKDATGNGGRGEVIGFLKVGFKKLYLFDQHDKVHECEPLCVLDFYVRASRQRLGCGKLLFDFMLRDTGARVRQLAIDGPSEKMESFVRKNYGIPSLRRQANNFAVPPDFFADTDVASASGRSTPSQSVAGSGRYSARKPPSSIGKVIHGGTPFNKNSIEDNKAKEAEKAEQSAEHVAAPSPLPPGPEPAAERPSSLLIETGEAASAPPPEPEAAEEPDAPQPGVGPNGCRSASHGSAAGAPTPRRESQLTGQGYFDIKYYHNKLW